MRFSGIYGHKFLLISGKICHSGTMVHWHKHQCLMTMVCQEFWIQLPFGSVFIKLAACNSSLKSFCVVIVTLTIQWLYRVRMLKQLVIHQTGSNFSTELSSFSHIKISIAKSKTQENRKKSPFVSQNIFYKASSQLKDLRNLPPVGYAIRIESSFSQNIFGEENKSFLDVLKKVKPLEICYREPKALSECEIIFQIILDLMSG